VSVVAEIRAVLLPDAKARHGPLPALLLALTFLTGVVDAASYLKLGHVFVANMTGNIVFLGFAIAGAGSISISASLTALAAFLLGAFSGGWITARQQQHRGHLLRGAIAAQALLVLVAFIVALTAREPIGDGSRYALLVPLALAMGLQNAAAQRLAIPELTTTVLTRTLTGIASEAHVLGGAGSQLGRRGLAVAAMLLGALCGGLLVLHVSVACALALALALSALVAIGVHILAAGDPPWQRP
jgi:uncharacterized membrane protein YoaK (UPF0700 family)